MCEDAEARAQPSIEAGVRLFLSKRKVNGLDKTQSEVPIRYKSRGHLHGGLFFDLARISAPHSAQSLQFVVSANDRNAQFLSTVARSDLRDVTGPGNCTGGSIRNSLPAHRLMQSLGGGYFLGEGIQGSNNCSNCSSAQA